MLFLATPELGFPGPLTYQPGQFSPTQLPTPTRSSVTRRVQPGTEHPRLGSCRLQAELQCCQYAPGKVFAAQHAPGGTQALRITCFLLQQPIQAPFTACPVITDIRGGEAFGSRDKVKACALKLLL